MFGKCIGVEDVVVVFVKVCVVVGFGGVWWFLVVLFGDDCFGYVGWYFGIVNEFY